MNHLNIRLATLDDLDSFFIYLNKHLLENGSNNTNFFQPVSKTDSALNDTMKLRFSKGITISIGEHGWRRLWLAFDRNNKVVGHIDIRSHPEAYTHHRVLLGTGVDSSFRKKGYGIALLKCMFD